MSMPIEVSWFWDWVPAAGRDAAQQTTWTRHLAGLLDTWTGATMDAARAARAAWPAGTKPEFPFTTGAFAATVARDLLTRADELPGNCRLIWGAGFVGGEVRWLPLLVVVEFRPARPGDSAYLMTMVGTEGFADDVREPNVEYVTTEHGDGIRVLALAGDEHNGVYGRVNAALRLERPPADIDVLLTTRVLDMGQVGVIGFGMDELMNMIATQFAAEPGDGVQPLRFSVPAGPEPS
jgi:hypothetical protein